MSKEIRMVELHAVANDENKMVLEGYAVVFGVQTQIGDNTYGFIEEISPRAFDDCNMKDVPLKYNHSDSVPILARTRNGSLVLSVDGHGLKVHAELLDTSDARDMYKRIEAGLLDKMSFAFSVKAAEWSAVVGELPHRTITQIERLYDVSVVDLPAYEDTTISARRKDYGYLEHCSAEIATIIKKYVTV